MLLLFDVCVWFSVSSWTYHTATYHVYILLTVKSYNLLFVCCFCCNTTEWVCVLVFVCCFVFSKMLSFLYLTFRKFALFSSFSRPLYRLILPNKFYVWTVLSLRWQFKETEKLIILTRALLIRMRPFKMPKKGWQRRVQLNVCMLGRWFEIT